MRVFHTNKKMAFVVAIDGPAGTGKGTITKLVAEELNLINILLVLLIKIYKSDEKIGFLKNKQSKYPKISK